MWYCACAVQGRCRGRGEEESEKLLLWPVNSGGVWMTSEAMTTSSAGDEGRGSVMSSGAGWFIVSTSLSHLQAPASHLCHTPAAPNAPTQSLEPLTSHLPHLPPRALYTPTNTPSLHPLTPHLPHLPPGAFASPSAPHAPPWARPLRRCRCRCGVPLGRQAGVQPPVAAPPDPRRPVGLQSPRRKQKQHEY